METSEGGATATTSPTSHAQNETLDQSKQDTAPNQNGDESNAVDRTAESAPGGSLVEAGRSHFLEDIAENGDRAEKKAGGFASLAKKITAKGKGKPAPPGGIHEERQNGICVDDLPLGSEAYSLSSTQTNGVDSRSTAFLDAPSHLPSSRSRAKGSMMGWQSFNSDVSTSAASSASLDMLLNDRQMDPEEVLFNLGFGGPQEVAYVPSLARIPQRFLQAAAQRAAATTVGIDNGCPDAGQQGEDTAINPSGCVATTGLAAAVQALQYQQGQGHGLSSVVGGSTAAAAAAPRKRTAFQTLARTISMMRGVAPRLPARTSPPVMSCSPAGTPPSGGAGSVPGGSGGVHSMSILSDGNQKYLASRGYYRQQGWLRGTYVETEEDQHDPNGPPSLNANDETTAGEKGADANSKRKMFHKTRSQRQGWSLCESGEKDYENGGSGVSAGNAQGRGEYDRMLSGLSGDQDSDRVHGRGREWFTKSMDDSLSQDEGMRARIDSVGQNTFFSTTTEESSTDSLDAAGSDTEKALEEIRRQYWAAHQNSNTSAGGGSVSSAAGRKESEKLFFPKRSGSTKVGVVDKKRSFGDNSVSSPGVFEEDDENVLNFGAGGSEVGRGRREDSIDDRAVRGSDADDESGADTLLIPERLSSNNYFISPASSRQTTVEKSPTLGSSAEDDFPSQSNHDSGQSIDEPGQPNHDDNNNDNNNGTGDDNNNNNHILEKDKIAANNHANLQGGKTVEGSGVGGDVKIIVSSIPNSDAAVHNSRGRTTSKDRFNANDSNRLSVDQVQTTSSDSGSSSSGGTTICGSSRSVIDPDALNVLSEESDGITDKDSISRTHSPCGFTASRPDTGRTCSDSSSSPGRVTMVSSVCQTSQIDFEIAAQAEQGEAVNATVRRSRSSGKPRFAFASEGRGVSNRALSISIDSEESGDKGKEASEEGNGKVKLSALSPSINPLELMRRLRHSQDQFLRTGSVQSDSSGFGDAEPSADSGHFDGDRHKLSSTGSSHDSDTVTLANNYASSHNHPVKQHQQPLKGEIATQTPAHLEHGKSTVSIQTVEESQVPDEESANHQSSFITTCFIPSLTHNKPGQDHASEGWRHHQPQHQRDPTPSHPPYHHPYHHPPPHLPHQPPSTYFPDEASVRSRSTSPGFKSDISSRRSSYPRNPYQSQPGYSYGPYSSVGPHSEHDYLPGGRFHQRGHETEERYSPGGFHPHRSQSVRSRSVMSDSEWTGYGPTEPRGPPHPSHSYNYDYTFNYPPPPQFPPHYPFGRRRSMDYYYDNRYDNEFDHEQPRTFQHEYLDNVDGKHSQRNSDSKNTPQPKRRYRSQLELHTTPSGKLETPLKRTPNRSGSVDEIFSSSFGTEVNQVASGNSFLSNSPNRRNQVPLSEELAAAMGGGERGDSTLHEATVLTQDLSPSSLLKVVSMNSDGRVTSPSQQRISVKVSKDVNAGEEKSPNIVSSITIPLAPNVIFTPATPEVSEIKNLSVGSLSSPDNGRNSQSALQRQNLQQPIHQRDKMISDEDQNLPTLAGNLRNLPQGRVSQPLSLQSPGPETPGIQASTRPSTRVPYTSTPMTPPTTTTAASHSTPTIRSRKQKSCDILEDDDNFSEGDPPSDNPQSTNPKGSSSFISHVYHETKPPQVFTVDVQATKNQSFDSEGQQNIRNPAFMKDRFSRPLPTPSPTSLKRSSVPMYHSSANHPSNPYGLHPSYPMHHRSFSSSSSIPPHPMLGRHHSYSRGSDDYDGYFSSSVAESSSEFSCHSAPGRFNDRAAILETRKLARLINQPVYFKGSRRPGAHYRPHRLFREWSMLSKRKRLQEENRLLQASLAKYKSELGVLEASLKVDYTNSMADMTPEERERVSNLEWLWSEIKGQVKEMEQLIIARSKSVQSGNHFHQLLANLGVIDKVKELIKEQMYQQQVVSSRVDDDEEEEDDVDDVNSDNLAKSDSLNNDEFDGELDFEETPDDLEMFDEEDYDVELVRHQRGQRAMSYEGFYQPRGRPPPPPSLSHSWVAGVGPASTPRTRGSHLRPRSHTGQISNRKSSSSTSNLPKDINVSLEQIKSSLMSQVQQEIKDSTRKLEIDLQTKDREIQELRRQMGERSANSTPDLSQRWRTTYSSYLKSRPSSTQGHDLPLKRSRSRVMGNRIVHETDSS